LIDEEEFEVKPAISRVVQLMELDTSTFKKKRKQFPENPDQFLTNFLFITGNTVLNERIDFTADLSFVNSINVDAYDVYINDNYYGSDVQKIQITTNDILRVEVSKTNNLEESQIKFDSKLI
jgi:hypothetical protein